MVIAVKAASVVGAGASALSADGDPTNELQGAIQNPKLQNIIHDLYKGASNTDKVGDGTNMDAIKNEILIGRPTMGRYHITKGLEYLQGLNNLVTGIAPLNQYDYSVAIELIRKLEEAYFLLM